VAKKGGIANPESGVRVTSRSRFLQRYCEGWLHHLFAYHKKLGDDDWPFWYGERPLIGFLAAGIWSADSVCIEEYLADKIPHKREPSARSKKKTYLGRGDLYFSSGRREGKVEFKKYDIGIARNRDFASFLKAKWRLVRADANKAYLHDDGIPTYGGMFLRPYIGKDRSPGRYARNLSELLKFIWETTEPDATAWWCPINRVVKSDHENTMNLVVGAILILKKVRG